MPSTRNGNASFEGPVSRGTWGKVSTEYSVQVQVDIHQMCTSQFGVP